jgi:hemerythrin
MFYIDWNEGLTVGVKQFDEHHKYLFELLNKIHISFDDNGQQDDSEAIIDELIAYSTYHFAAEEGLLSEHNYFDLLSQEKEHKYFTLKVLEFKRDIISGKNIYSTELLWFLGNWLLHHIMETDKKYSAQL